MITDKIRVPRANVNRGHPAAESQQLLTESLNQKIGAITRDVGVTSKGS